MTIVKQIDIALCRIPLEVPVQLGPATIARRDYAAVQLELSDGSQGYAYGYDRGMPLFEMVVQAGRGYLGQAPEMRNALRTSVLGATPAPRSSMVRGVSLCDIALWDAWCISRGLPLWAALGGARDSVPVMPVIGYGMTPERAANDGKRLADEGFSTIKLMIDGRDLAADRTVIKALADALPADTRFGIDAHWSWTTLDQALPFCRMAEDLGAVFVEDPFAPSNWRAVHALSGKVDVPLAVGEDVTDLAGFRDLVEGAGILRIDAAASGGIAAACEAAALARAHDLAVIPHVFAPLH